MEAAKEKEETTKEEERENPYQNLFHDPLTNQIWLKSPKKKNSLRGFLLTLPTFWDEPCVFVFWVSFKAIYGRRRDLQRPIAITENSTGNISINTSKGDSVEQENPSQLTSWPFFTYCAALNGEIVESCLLILSQQMQLLRNFVLH